MFDVEYIYFDLIATLALLIIAIAKSFIESKNKKDN